MKEKRYEAAYAGFVYEAPATHWTPSTVVRQRLTKMDFTKPDGIELGGMPIISDGQTAFVDAADGHTAVLACSGMKKSICGFMPLIVSLAQAGENLIVTDPKGELYDRTAGLLQHRGYQVYCLNFRSMDKDCFNILSYAAEVYRNGDQNKGLSLLSDIVNALAEEQRQRAKDNFWPDTAALWLNGTGAVMLDAFPDIKQVNVLNWSDFNVWSSAQIVEEHLLKKMPDNTAKAALRQCLSSPENTFRSILITASSFFGMFNQNPKLAAMLSHSTFTLGDLTNPKTALFLVTDDTTSTAEPILAMIISQIQSYLVDKAYHSKDGKLGTRMNFVLDEFASLPIPNMPKALATHRSRNIRYYLCIQSLALLKQRYPDPEMILSNCGSMLYLGSTELEMLKELETKLGTTRVTPDGSEKPLCSQAELMTLVKAFWPPARNILPCPDRPSESVVTVWYAGKSFPIVFNWGMAICAGARYCFGKTNQRRNPNERTSYEDGPERQKHPHSRTPCAVPREKGQGQILYRNRPADSAHRCHGTRTSVPGG